MLEDQLDPVEMLQKHVFLPLTGDPLISLVSSHTALMTQSKYDEQQQVWEAQRLLAAIVAFSNDAIISKTLDGIITSWNAAAVLLFGYSAQEAVGQHISLIIPPERRGEETEIIKQLRLGNRIGDYRTVRITKDGRSIHVSLSISPIVDRQGEIVGAAKIARDITESVQEEQRKDEFISMASHELNTPVTSLKGFTSVLQRRLGKQGDERGLYYLSRMDAQLDRLAKLVKDILDLSRMQKGKLEYQWGVFELDVLVYETVENVQAATLTHCIELRGQTGAQIVGDKDRLEQVLINVLTNAIKYSAQADRVVVSLACEKDVAVIRVRDYGIGIDKLHQQKIFDRFYQVTEPQEKTYPGLGIGLYISREIIEQHHGRIEVESRRGEGATFSLFLPMGERRAGL